MAQHDDHGGGSPRGGRAAGPAGGPHAESSAGAPAAGRVIVVSGLPRSGTSMMMQMLAAGGVPVLADDTRPADADNPRGYFEAARVRRLARDAAWLAEAAGCAVKVIAALLPALPAGPRWDVLFMTRPLDAVLASQAVMLRRRGEPAERCDVEMAALFERHLARVRAVVDARPDVRRLDVAYDAVIDAPDQAAAAVAGWLGGGLDVRAMAAAVEPALRHHRSRGAPGAAD